MISKPVLSIADKINEICILVQGTETQTIENQFQYLFGDLGDPI